MINIDLTKLSPATRDRITNEIISVVRRECAECRVMITADLESYPREDEPEGFSARADMEGWRDAAAKVAASLPGFFSHTIKEIKLHPSP